MFHSEENMFGFTRKTDGGFTLAEILASLTILSIIISGVVLVVQRCKASAADLTLKMQAFEVARDNMEQLLSTKATTEKIEYGTSEKYPDINWKMVVETFREPVSSDMWVRAVSSAEYTDYTGEIRRVELTNWLTDVSEKLQKKVLEQKAKEEEQASVATSLEEAAEYAGVNIDTIKRWLLNGMRITESGGIPFIELDLYAQTGGDPTFEERVQFQQMYSPDEMTTTGGSPFTDSGGTGSESFSGQGKTGARQQPDGSRQRGSGGSRKGAGGGGLPDFSNMSDDEIDDWVNENLK